MRTITCCMAIVLLALLGPAALAQESEEVQVRTLLIQDGKVFIDGRPVPVGESAGVSLGELEGDYFQMTWMGERAPMFPLSGRWFRVERDRLVPHSEVVAPTPDAGMHMEVMAPRVQAARSAEEARRTVEVYLRDLQSQNRNLFRRLSDEERMELEARELATRFRSAQSDRQRRVLEAQLREQLDQILEIKHQNRLAEIQQLEYRLQELKASLQTREQMRQELIERRIKELTGRPE